MKVAKSRWLRPRSLPAIALGILSLWTPATPGQPVDRRPPQPSDLPRAWAVHFNENPTQSQIVTAEFAGERAEQMSFMVGELVQDSAIWTDWKPRFEVDLGQGDGAREVWVGLRNRSGAANWRRFMVNVDSTAPRVTLVGVPALTHQPVIQVLGCASEPIGTVQYDLENGAGSQRGQDGFGVERTAPLPPGFARAYWFQLFDVELAPGTNTLNVRVEDRAGHTTEVHGTVVFDVTGDDEAPQFAVHWPEQGSQIAGTPCTIRGEIDDPSATIFLSGPALDLIEGTVERNGQFWLEKVPLNPGTNSLVILATDAAGNRSQASLVVVHTTGFKLKMDPVPPAELVKPRTTVTGTISTNDHSVWVNGVKAALADSPNEAVWRWIARDVPIPPGGTAVFQMRAIPNSDNGGHGTPAGVVAPNQAKSSLPGCVTNPAMLLARVSSTNAANATPAEAAEVRALLRRCFLAEPHAWEPVLQDLAQRATPAAQAVLLQLALEGPGANERRAAARHLVSRRDPRIRDQLLHAVDPGVRAEVFWAHRNTPITSGDQVAFGAALLDDDLNLRLAALTAIAAAPRIDGVESLVARIYQSSTSVPGQPGTRQRIGAGGTTVPLGSPAGRWAYHMAHALRNLRQLHTTSVAAPDPALHLAVDCHCVAEAWRGSSEAKEALFRVLVEAPEPELRLAAVEGFDRIGSPDDWDRVRGIAANDPLVVDAVPTQVSTGRGGPAPVAPSKTSRPVFEEVERRDRTRSSSRPATGR